MSSEADPLTLTPFLPQIGDLDRGSCWAPMGATFGVLGGQSSQASAPCSQKEDQGCLSVCLTRGPCFPCCSCLSSCLPQVTSLSFYSLPLLQSLVSTPRGAPPHTLVTSEGTAPKALPSCSPPPGPALLPPRSFSSFIGFLLSCPSPRAPTSSGREACRTLFPLFKVSRLVSQEGAHLGHLVSTLPCLQRVTAGHWEGRPQGARRTSGGGEGRSRCGEGVLPGKYVSVCARVHVSVPV